MLFESTRCDPLDMFLQNRNSSTRFGYWSSWWARVDCASRAAKNSPQGCFCPAVRKAPGRSCSNPPVAIPLICFYRTETPAPDSDTGVLGGRGWIARAAHLKKPLRGFFAAGTYGGGRCCSNPPAAIPLICFYKTETPAPGSDTGVLGGRGWIARAALLKTARRAVFARRYAKRRAAAVRIHPCR